MHVYVLQYDSQIIDVLAYILTETKTVGKHGKSKEALLKNFSPIFVEKKMSGRTKADKLDALEKRGDNSAPVLILFLKEDKTLEEALCAVDGVVLNINTSCVSTAIIMYMAVYYVGWLGYHDVHNEILLVFQATFLDHKFTKNEKPTQGVMKFIEKFRPRFAKEMIAAKNLKMDRPHPLGH